MEAKEFFKLLDAENNQHSGDLDEFDLEALEGLRMVKDPAQAKIVTDANIDKKLEQLIAEEKNTKSRTGLYFMSIAASIVLILGLFFIFKNVNSDVAVAEKSAEQTTGSATAPNADLESTIAPSNSDAGVVEEKKAPVPNEQSEKGYGLISKNNKGMLAPVSSAEYQFALTDSVVLRDGIKADDKIADYESVQEVKQKIVSNKPVTKETESVVGGINNENKDSKYVSDEDNRANKNVVLAEVAKKDELKKREVKSKEKVEEVSDVAAAPVVNPAEPKVAPASTVNANSVVTNTGATTLTTTNEVGLANPTYLWKNSANGAGSGSIVEAQFVGGLAAFNEYIKKHLVVPASCASEEVIIIRFSVDNKGLVSKPKILSKTGNCPDCEKEAIRFVKAMPAWTPAMQNGAAVSSYKTITLSFKK